MTEKKEEPKQVNLQELTIEQLKVLAYDTLLLVQRNQNNLNAIQQEIANRDK